MTAFNEYMIKDMNRTDTIIKSIGLYKKSDKEKLYMNDSDTEVFGVNQNIKEVDPSAFVLVTEAYDAFGEGWKQLPNAGELQPE